MTRGAGRGGPKVVLLNEVSVTVSSPKRDIHLYGPQGTSRMVDDFFRVMSYDVSMRMQDEK